MLARRASAPALARVALALAALAGVTRADAALPPSEWRYRSNADLASALDALHAGPCAGMSSVTSIGTSVQGEEMRVLEVSSDPGTTQAKPSFAFFGNMHGDEPVGRELILRLAELVCGAANADGLATSGVAVPGDITSPEPGDERFVETAAWLATHARLFFAPTLNPDGFAARARANARGVDLNRDWPDQYISPARSSSQTRQQSDTDLSISLPADALETRQPETAAVLSWSRTVNVTGALSFHEGAVVANYPWDAKRNSKKAEYARCPDDAAFRRLARAYADGHPTMHASREFKGGITNGAKWYPLWGGMQDWHYIATGTMSVTIEVNDLKFPKASELGRLWREHRGGIFAAATVATRGALRGFVLDATTTEPITNAALTVKGVEFPFAPNALGFFARPVSGQRDPVGGDDAATTPFLVTVTATAPGYVADEKTVTVDPLDGVDLVFEMVRVEINGLGGRGGGRRRGGRRRGPASGGRNDVASVRGWESRAAADRTGDGVDGVTGPSPPRGGVGRRRVRRPGGRGDDTQAARARGEGEGGLKSRGRVIDVCASFVMFPRFFCLHSPMPK
jgi:carboxypeptidase D